MPQLLCNAKEANVDSFDYLAWNLWFPLDNPIIMRHIFHYISGRICLTPPSSPLRRSSPAQAVNQAGELQQVGHTEQRPLPAEDDLGIGRNNIRPLRWNRANCTIIHLEQERPAKTVVPVPCTDQLPPAEWMERMRHTHKTGGCV